MGHHFRWMTVCYVWFGLTAGHLRLHVVSLFLCPSSHWLSDLIEMPVVQEGKRRRFLHCRCAGFLRGPTFRVFPPPPVDGSLFLAKVYVGLWH